MSTPTPTPAATPPPAAPASTAASLATPTPTPTTTPPPANAGAPIDSNPGSWKAGFNDDLKGYVDLKGFKDPAALAEAYRNFEKLQGVPQDKILKLSDTTYDEKGNLTPEARSVFERLGAPKEAKDYQLQVPKEGGDPKLMEHFQNVFHEAGVPKSAAEKIVNSWNEFQAKAVNDAKEAAKAAFTQADQNLKKEWGAAFEQNVNIAKEAVRSLGIDGKAIDAIAQALGHDKTMKLFKDLGAKVGEMPFVGGNQPRVLEPTSAQARITELRGDRDFGRRLLAGEVEAKRIWENLHRQAYPGDVSLR